MRRFAVLILAVIVFVADQCSKYWAVIRLAHGQDLVLIPKYFELVLTTNTGAAFGMFQSATVLLGLIALGAAVAIITYVVRHRNVLPNYQTIALGLALGGACGNFLDRFRLHHVIDFIFVHLGTYPWPIFNVADSAICVGVVILGVKYAFLAGKPICQVSSAEPPPSIHGSSAIVEHSVGPTE